MKIETENAGVGRFKLKSGRDRCEEDEGKS